MRCSCADGDATEAGELDCGVWYEIGGYGLDDICAAAMISGVSAEGKKRSQSWCSESVLRMRGRRAITYPLKNSFPTRLECYRDSGAAHCSMAVPEDADHQVLEVLGCIAAESGTKSMRSSAAAAAVVVEELDVVDGRCSRVSRSVVDGGEEGPAACGGDDAA